MNKLIVPYLVLHNITTCMYGGMKPGYFVSPLLSCCHISPFSQILCNTVNRQSSFIVLQIGKSECVVICKAVPYLFWNGHLCVCVCACVCFFCVHACVSMLACLHLCVCAHVPVCFCVSVGGWVCKCVCPCLCEYCACACTYL